MIVALLVAAALLAAAFLWARGQLNDTRVPLARSLIPPGATPVVLAVWAHPDDEITCAGTLAAMAGAGAKVCLLYLTAGEAARVPGHDRQSLAPVRRAEAQAAGRVLGLAEVEVLDFPDGGLAQTDPESAKAAIRTRIDRLSPSLVISFDERIGYYGHPDHVAVGRWTREVAGEPGSPVRRLCQVTLPRALIRLAMRLVAAFRDNYPADPARGLPAPDLAVPIAPQAAIKRALLDVHASQKAVIADVQPGYDRVPPWLYYRLFDREYFALAGER
jgi:LmbE family N-acetylglucosaminyl deacetylase